MQRKRIAVIGGGVTGLGAAYCLDAENLDVTLFEKNSYLGGNAHNVYVNYGDKVIAVDDAFDVFWPKRYPYFLAWLKILDVKTELMKFSQTICDIYRNTKCIIYSKDHARFNSRRMLSYLLRLRILLNKIQSSDIDPNLTMKEFLDTIPEATQDFRNEFFFPMIGHPYYAPTYYSENFYPARMICNSIADYLFYQHTILQITDGCQRYVDKVKQSFKHVKVKLATEIKKAHRNSEGWHLEDQSGNTYQFDTVILTCPPSHMAKIIRDDSESLSNLLNSIPIVPAKCMVHSDTTFMPYDKKYWAFYNYLIHPRLAKPIASLWSGQKYDKAPVFTTMEFGEPIIEENHIKSLYATNYFTLVPCTHELLVKREQLLKHYQGVNNLYFAGAWVVDTPSHEHGLEAALNVIREVYPESVALRTLEYEASLIRNETITRPKLKPKAQLQEWAMDYIVDPLSSKLIPLLNLD
jgi:predicted NAD/FAD-binding protein